MLREWKHGSREGGGKIGEKIHAKSLRAVFREIQNCFILLKNGPNS